MTETEMGQAVSAKIPPRLSGLEKLANNLWWSWHPEARMLFKNLDRQLWKESRHNPFKMLSEISGENLTKAAENSEYLRHFDLVLSKFENYMGERQSPLMGEGSAPDGQGIHSQIL